MLVTPIDLAFVAAGLVVVVWALRRRWTPFPPPARRPSASLGELVLTALALVPAAVGPNVLVVALTPGMPGMPVLVRWALIPSIILLGIVWAVAHARGYDRLTNRIWVGLWVGAAATAALDFFRLSSFLLGFLPGNLPRMFGVLILDTMAIGPTPASDFIGALYHFWVSACFGLTYTLIIGRTRWWGGLIWGLIIEVGMMTTPPMVIAMDTGYFVAETRTGAFERCLHWEPDPPHFLRRGAGLAPRAIRPSQRDNLHNAPRHFALGLFAASDSCPQRIMVAALAQLYVKS